MKYGILQRNLGKGKNVRYYLVLPTYKEPVKVDQEMIA